MQSEIVKFRNEVADKLRERTEANRSTDALQAELDERMSKIAELVDLDSLFEDGDGPGGMMNLPTNRLHPHRVEVESINGN